MSSPTITAARQIERVLAAPSTVAQMLNWQMNLSRPVLTLHMGESSIDLAMLSHPRGCMTTTTATTTAAANPIIQSLPSIPLLDNGSTRSDTNKKGLHHPHHHHLDHHHHQHHNNHHKKNLNKKLLGPTVLKQLSSIVEQHHVCGLVVSWPVQREGWVGAPCGRVLHALDQLVQDTTIVNPARPLCLWDGYHHHHANNDDDERFDRLPNYCGTTTNAASSNKTLQLYEEYKASQEQYHEEGMPAAAIAADYLQSHWPEFTGRPRSTTSKCEAEDWRGRDLVAPKDDVLVASF